MAKSEQSKADKNDGPIFLREWRIAKGMTQADLAELVGTNANMIGYLEAGERSMSTAWLRKLGAALGIPKFWIIEFRPGEEPTDELPDNVRNIWTGASLRQRKQILKLSQAIVTADEDDREDNG